MASATSHPSEGPLPTLKKLGVQSVPQNLDAIQIATEWFEEFSKSFSHTPDVNLLSNLFLPSTYSYANYEQNDPSALSCYWRDILSLTWDFRTFEGHTSISKFLEDRLAQAEVKNVKLGDSLPLVISQPYEDLAWIMGYFTFETRVGSCSGIFRLVPYAETPSGTLKWFAHSMFTGLEELHGFPELGGAHRNVKPDHGHWLENREKELRFEESDPAVLIIGGGQTGMAVAARLKALGVGSLLVEKNATVGDSWRQRYDALYLHDPVWYDHMPYLPFPPTWPAFTPAKKMAQWLEVYAIALELNIWTSTAVKSAVQDPETKRWSVKVQKASGEEREFNVRYLVFATGFHGGKIPEYLGMGDFKGQILHSTQYKTATDHIGKKVVVIGACTSGHDIASDYVEKGVDVTMFQRSSTYVMSTKNGIRMVMQGLYEEGSPPTDFADKIANSFSMWLNVGLVHRLAKGIAEADKETLDGLHKVGFRTNMGVREAGHLLLVWDKVSGYYLDVGASQLIIDGKIKLKNDSLIERFTETGLKFENGSELNADVVVFCTGLGDPREHIRQICGDAVADNCSTLWGLDEDGEINGVWRDMGFQGLWYAMGNLALTRYHSKNLALQIKAMEEGIFNGERYSLKTKLM
ncbi:hypothetical protein BDQ17DRAFT_1388982 [Cyathus striatus]|nr:hypothetical protein BDQ17DRAFT_1388982 [Cyathus striatus]